jgi:hypothetical protein
MPIELICFIIFLINANLIVLIIILIKKFKINGLRDCIRSLENEKLENHAEILELHAKLCSGTRENQFAFNKPNQSRVITMN